MFPRLRNPGFRLANVWMRLRHIGWQCKIWFAQVAGGDRQASVIRKPTRGPAGKKDGKDPYKIRGSKTQTKKEGLQLR